MTRNRMFSTLAAAFLLACCPVAMTVAQDEEAAPAKDEATALAKYDRWVTSLGFSPANNLLVTAGGQSLQYRPGDVKIWDATSGNLVASFEGHSSNVWSVAISADGKTLITSGYDGKVIVFDVESKKATATLASHKGWCRSVAITPDGKHFASAGEDGTVRLWDVSTGRQKRQFEGHESLVLFVDFSPDGHSVASASGDGTIRVWDVREGK